MQTKKAKIAYRSNRNTAKKSITPEPVNGIPVPKREMPTFQTLDHEGTPLSLPINQRKEIHEIGIAGRELQRQERILHLAIAGHVACAILRRVIQAKLEERAPEAVPYKEVNAYTLREIKSGGGLL